MARRQASTPEDRDAAAGAILSITDEYGRMLAPAFIRAIAYAAIKGARDVIEDQQRKRDAETAIGESTTKVENGVTIIAGDWRRAKFAAEASSAILATSPNHVGDGVIILRQELIGVEPEPVPMITVPEPTGVIEAETIRLISARRVTDLSERVNRRVSTSVTDELDKSVV